MHVCCLATIFLIFCGKIQVKPGKTRDMFFPHNETVAPKELGVVDEGIVHQTTVILPSTILLGHRFLRSRLSLKKTPRDMIKKTKVTTWVFPKIVGFTPKSSILVGFSIINRPFWGIPIFGNTHMLLMDKILHHQGWWLSHYGFNHPRVVQDFVHQQWDLLSWNVGAVLDGKIHNQSWMRFLGSIGPPFPGFRSENQCHCSLLPNK